MIKTITTELNIGLSAPVTLLHISDTHLCLCDDRDCARKLELAGKRVKHFPKAEETLIAVSALQRETGAPILHTGDLLDFVSAANIDRAKRFIDEHDVFFAAGNHEFSLFVGEAWEDADYRNQSLDRVQAAFANDIRFSSRIIGGVNFVAIDDGYYRFDEDHLDRLRAEAARGMPIVLMMHNPLYDRGLYDLMQKRSKAGLAYLTAVPEPLIRHYDDYRYRQQLADEPTLAVFDYIKREPMIRAVIAGHLHFDYVGAVTDTLPQIVTGIGTIRRIVIR